MSIIEERLPAGIPASRSVTQPTNQRSTDQLAAGWFDDPEAKHRMRYFDGNGWTEHVTHYGPTPCSGCG